MSQPPGNNGNQHQDTSTAAKMVLVHETIEAMISTDKLEDFLNAELRLSALRLESLFATELRRKEPVRELTNAINSTTEIARELKDGAP